MNWFSVKNSYSKQDLKASFLWPEIKPRDCCLCFILAVHPHSLESASQVSVDARQVQQLLWTRQRHPTSSAPLLLLSQLLSQERRARCVTWRAAAQQQPSATRLIQKPGEATSWRLEGGVEAATRAPRQQGIASCSLLLRSHVWKAAPEPVSPHCPNLSVTTWWTSSRKRKFKLLLKDPSVTEGYYSVFRRNNLPR